MFEGLRPDLKWNSTNPEESVLLGVDSSVGVEGVTIEGEREEIGSLLLMRLILHLR